MTDVDFTRFDPAAARTSAERFRPEVFRAGLVAAVDRAQQPVELRRQPGSAATLRLAHGDAHLSFNRSFVTGPFWSAALRC